MVRHLIASVVIGIDFVLFVSLLLYACKLMHIYIDRHLGHHCFMANRTRIASQLSSAVSRRIVLSTVVLPICDDGDAVQKGPHRK